MIPFEVWQFRRISRRYAVPLLVCFYVFVFVAAGDGQTSRVSRLIGQMHDRDDSKRWSAVQELVKIGTPAVEPLIAALKDPRWYVRESAVDALGEINDPRVIEPLIAVLNDMPSVQSAAKAALIKIGVPAVEQLISALKDADARVRRWNAASVLGEIKDPRAVEPLIAALNDTDYIVRRTAVSSLGEIKDLRMVEPLITALKDKDVGVRDEAAEVLGEIKDPRMVERLIAFLMKPGDIPSFDSRAAVVAMLILFKDPRADGALKAVGPEMITNATSRLITRGEPGSEDALIEVLNAFGDKWTAKVFLNCGNSKLENAGRAWAKKNGYGIAETTLVGDQPHWPSKR
jgi:HEAT repeat protein